MPRLVVRLLGGYWVELDGQAVYGFETDKARALLAYLMVEADRPHRRETLASLLWPDRPDTVARANLRQALASLRRALSDHGPPFFLLATPTDLQFNIARDYTLDVAELEAFARSPASPHPNSPGPHTQLLPDTFCADFLAGFAVPNSEAFEAWVLNKQEFYHRLALEILDDENASFEATGDYERAVAAARLQLQMEPWLEEAHRRCMRGLALAGRRDEALHQYDVCCRALQTELGVEPAAGTQALYADIRAGRLGANRDAPGRSRGGCAEAAKTRPVTLSDPRSRQPSIGQPQGLSLQAAGTGRFSPLRYTRPITLLAREDQLAQLASYLQTALAGETGVVFVSGDAGSGKTALLETFAAAAMAEHPDLLVAGARCNPGGQVDAFAALRRLAEMLFGDPANNAAWLLGEQDQVDRLQSATGSLLASLEEHGSDLVDSLIPATAVARRASAFASNAAAEQPAWWLPLQATLQIERETRQQAMPGSQVALSRGRLFDGFICTLAAIARGQPLLLLLDDLHWVDEATAAFLAHLGRELTRSPVFVLGAYRSATVNLGRCDPQSGETVRHPLAETVNELRRVKGEIVIELDRADGHAFVEALVDTEPNRLGARFRDALYAHTGGHALFTVESLRNLQARGEIFKDEAGRWTARESLDWGRLPARVEAAIAERIERLPEASRRLLSAASVQGDDFTAELVAELADAPVGQVIASLSGSLARQHQLVRPEGIQRQGTVQRSVYRFTHHLFQKYLYDQLDPVERGRWHAAVASSLERQVGDDLAERERFGARLAWHYESAGLPLEAARALLDAGRQATRVSAFREALSLFDHGLALLKQADTPGTAGKMSIEPKSAERIEIERLLQVARFVPQRSLGGSGGMELEGSLARIARSGSDDVQDRTKLVTLEAEADHLIARGQFEELFSVAERMLELATRRGDESFVALAHFWFGFGYNIMGEPRKAESYLEWILLRHAPGRWADTRAAVGFDVMPHVLTFSAINEAFLGYPETALKHSIQAVTTAQQLGDIYGLAFASACGSMTLFLLRSDPSSLQERSKLACRVCEKHGFTWWQHYAEVFLGWVAVMRSEHAEGIEHMQNAIAAWQATGMVAGNDSHVVVLVDAYLEAARRLREEDDPTAAAARFDLLTDALARIDGVVGPSVPCGQSYQAELHRLRGELLLARDGRAAAEEALACFNRAAELGWAKGALIWELRAAMSLVRLWKGQGQPFAAELAEARRRLRDIYDRFTEGFAFPDLLDAAALLSATAGARSPCAPQRVRQ